MINFMKVNFIENNCNIVNDGFFNMELDGKVLKDAIESSSSCAFIRFYQWYPKCITLGRNQKEDEINNCQIDVVKRLTGGRAILHENELTYSVVCPIFDESVISSYKKISLGLILGFKKLGIDLNFAREKDKLHHLQYCMEAASFADISYKNRKFIGSAQYRTNGYLLQHGSIPYSLDVETLEKIFNKKPNTNSFITLNEIKQDLSTRQIIEALKEGFIEAFDKIN